MKILKYIFGGLLSLIILIVLVGFFLPSRHQLKESIVINAPVNAVFDEVNNLRNWSNWSPWQGKDPNAIISYEGPSAGVGAKMLWSSTNPRVGKGTQEIVVSVANRNIKTVLSMEGWDNTSNGIWDFEEQGPNKTKVTWGFDTQLGGNIFYKYMIVMCKSTLRKDYIQGLQQLKAHLEG